MRCFHSHVHAKLGQPCLTLWDPMDCSLSSSSVCGTLQAKVLEWVAISFSRGSSPRWDETRVSGASWNGRQILYHSRHLGSSHSSTHYKLLPGPPPTTLSCILLIFALAMDHFLPNDSVQMGSLIYLREASMLSGHQQSPATHPKKKN